jgi:hypothetical protein
METNTKIKSVSVSASPEDGNRLNYRNLSSHSLCCVCGIDPGFVSRRGQEIFLFSKISRPAVGPHPASSTVGTGNPFPGDEADGA